MAVSALELAFHPSECVHQSVHWPWLPLPWSEAGPGTDQVLFSQSVCTLVGNSSLHLSGEQLWNKSGWSRLPLPDGGMPGWSWQAGQSSTQFPVCCFCAATGSKQVCACTLQECSLGFLQPSSKPRWFSDHQGGLSS